MSEIRSEMDSDIEQNYSISSKNAIEPADLKELSVYVSRLFEGFFFLGLN